MVQFFSPHSSSHHKKVLDVGESIFQPKKMLFPFCYYNGIPALGKSVPHIGHEHSVPLFIVDDQLVNGVDRRLFLLFFRQCQFCISDDDLMVEGTFHRLPFVAYSITDRAALHKNDRMVTILPRNRRGKTKHKLAFALPEYGFKGKSAQMMAFIHDHHAVSGDQVINDAALDQTLYGGHINNACWLPFPDPMTPIAEAGIPRKDSSRAFH